MPDLKIFLVCEKVIQDKEQDGLVTLIGVFSKLTVTVPSDAPDVPANAVAPKEWAVFSAWEPTEPDHGKTYDLFTKVLYPDGEQFGEIAKIKVLIETGKRSQCIVRFLGLPIGKPGVHSVQQWMESEGKTVGEVLTLQVEIRLIRQAPPPKQGG